jgi:hypothetical protein
MDGTVTTYDSSTGALVVNVASVNGSGTYASWQVMVLPSATGNFADKSTANTFTDVQTFTGGVAANPLVKKQSDPTAGGALLLEKSSGSSLSGNLKIELSGNSLRIYENGGSSRGVTLDITTLAASIADKILTTASLKNSTNDPTFSSTSNTDAITPEWWLGASPFTKEYVSGEQTITSSGTLSIAHGLGAKPKIFTAKLVCKTAENGFSVNDEVEINIAINSELSDQGVAVYTNDSANIRVKFGSASSVFRVIGLTSGATVSLTNANWRLIISAWV